jgi:hypothetical protein
MIPWYDAIPMVLRCAIVVAVGLYVGYCAFAGEDTSHKRVGLVVGMSLYGMLCMEEGRIRERREPSAIASKSGKPSS